VHGCAPVCDLSDELRLPGGICDLRGQRQITALLEWRIQRESLLSEKHAVSDIVSNRTADFLTNEMMRNGLPVE
jgi:hypothetical protein